MLHMNECATETKAKAAAVKINKIQNYSSQLGKQVLNERRLGRVTSSQDTNKR